MVMLIFGFVFFSIFSIINGNIENEDFKTITTTVNESVQNDNYKLEVVTFKTVEDVFNKLGDGYEYLEFSLTLQNLSGDKLMREDVECIVDGTAQENQTLPGFSTLLIIISNDLTVKVTATFAVPKNAVGYDIKYGSDVVVHVPKSKN